MLWSARESAAESEGSSEPSALGSAACGSLRTLSDGEALALSPSRSPLPPFSSPPVPLDFSSPVSPFSVPDARAAVSNLGQRRWKWLEAARPPGLCAPRSRCPQRPQLPASQNQRLGSVACSPWVALPGSLPPWTWFILGRTRPHAWQITRDARVSPRAAQGPAGWLPGSGCAAAPSRPPQGPVGQAGRRHPGELQPAGQGQGRDLPGSTGSGRKRSRFLRQV